MRRLLVLTAVVAAAVCRADDRGLAREIAIGKSAASRVERDYRLLPDQEVQSEVIRIGQKIAERLPKQEHPYVFKVVVGESAAPLNEPSAFPGGFVYVPSAGSGRAVGGAGCGHDRARGRTCGRAAHGRREQEGWVGGEHDLESAGRADGRYAGKVARV